MPSILAKGTTAWNSPGQCLTEPSRGQVCEQQIHGDEPGGRRQQEGVCHAAKEKQATDDVGGNR
jgi:hypothetical protein